MWQGDLQSLMLTSTLEMSMKRKPTKTKLTPDVLVRDAGTLFTFCPLTPRAKAWIAEYVQPDAQWFGNALVCEHRYALPLAQGMIDEGLVLA